MCVACVCVCVCCDGVCCQADYKDFTNQTAVNPLPDKTLDIATLDKLTEKASYLSRSKKDETPEGESSATATEERQETEGTHTTNLHLFTHINSYKLMRCSHLILLCVCVCVFSPCYRGAKSTQGREEGSQAQTVRERGGG